MTMIRTSLVAFAFAVIAAGSPADAASYPVTGKWGQSTSTEKGPVDCSKLRVIAFNGDQRTDSKGGVPAYRNKTVQAAGAGTYRVVDEFTTGQVANGKATYTLRIDDPEHVELNMQPGGQIKLRKCK